MFPRITAPNYHYRTVFIYFLDDTCKTCILKKFVIFHLGSTKLCDLQDFNFFMAHLKSSRKIVCLILKVLTKFFQENHMLNSSMIVVQLVNIFLFLLNLIIVDKLHFTPKQMIVSWESPKVNIWLNKNTLFNLIPPLHYWRFRALG